MSPFRLKEDPGAGARAADRSVRKASLIAHLRPRGQGTPGFLLALGLAGLFLGACTTPKVGQPPATKEAAPPAAPAPKPSQFLPSLQVATDSCYAFLRPDETSRRFGPLVKNETLKWLDAQGPWTRVWIPRLRVSGWVLRAQVSEAPKGRGRSEAVPTHYMSTVTVIVRKANIREGPTTQSEIITVAKRNQEFWLLKQEGGWYQIWLPDLKQKGWISGKIAARLRRE